MLIIARKMGELSFLRLMAVYAESNRETGEDFFPGEPEMRQLALAEERARQYLQEDFFAQPGAFYALWQVEGRYVSALRLEPYRDGQLLEGLETDPDHRRRGYAGALMKAVLELPGVGKVYSHVGKRNLASLAVHKSCGFRIIADVASYVDGSVDDRCYTLLYEK